MSSGLEYNIDSDSGEQGRTPGALKVLPPPPAQPPVESLAAFAVTDGEPPVFGGVNPEGLALPLMGSEPAVFGGLNLDAGWVGDELTDGEAVMMEVTAAAMEENELRLVDLLGDVPQINVKAVMTSSTFLLSLLVVLLIAATVFIQASVGAETYVYTTVRFVNYDKLDEPARQELRHEINRLMRTLPVRAEAWDLLQKRRPGLIPGFLGSGLTFYRMDSLAWDRNGVLRLRVDTDDPDSDVIRLGSVVDAFYNRSLARNQRRDDSCKELADEHQKQSTLLQLDADLKKHIDEQLIGAQRYIDIKAALRATERYLQLADQSNPLRLVARQELKRLAAEVGEARGVAVERDEKVTARISVEKEIDDLAASMAQLHKNIDTFAYPEVPDQKALGVFDSRPRQKAALRGTWLGLIALFGGIIGHFRYQERQQEASEREERRRQRRQAALSLQEAGRI
jgi:hypothetical protein